MQWIQDAASSLASAFGYDYDNQDDEKDDNRSGLQAVTASAQLQHSTMLSKVQAYEPWWPSVCQNMDVALITCSSPTCRQQISGQRSTSACMHRLPVRAASALIDAFRNL